MRVPLSAIRFDSDGAIDEEVKHSSAWYRHLSLDAMAQVLQPEPWVSFEP